MGKRKIRMILADDQDAFRQILAAMLEEFSECEIVAQASDGQEAIDLARHLMPDVVIMDLRMPGMDGIDAARTIRSELPDVQVIGLSMLNDAEARAAMQRAGAVTYISKMRPWDEVIATIRTVVQLRMNAAGSGSK